MNYSEMLKVIQANNTSNLVKKVNCYTKIGEIGENKIANYYNNVTIQ